MRSDETQPPGTILIAGASRGLGEAMAAEFLGRGWTVVGTVRGDGPTGLHDLAATHPDRLAIERLDITDPDGIAALRDRLSGLSLDILFINGGIVGSPPQVSFVDVATEEFTRVFATNALGAMRAVAVLQALVRAGGMVGVMSSGQGSVANNTGGGDDVYRASKAALNQLMRSHAARHAEDGRSFVLMAPGWIRTDLGGPKAPFGIDEAVPQVVDTLIAGQGRPGLRFIDRHGVDVPW